MNYVPPIAVSVGEPAGIGPDLVLQAARDGLTDKLVVVADRTMLEARAAHLGLSLNIQDYTGQPPPYSAGTLAVLHTPLATPVTPGQLNQANSAGVLAALTRAAQGCTRGEFGALVTAPIHKGVICDSGVAFSGHTEFLAELTETARVVMLLASGSLRVALATTHLPLAAVPAAINVPDLLTTLKILDGDLRGKFGISAPRIAVLGLNPHAGEGGHLGREELDVIIPALEAADADGLQVNGPWPADTAFNPGLRATTDAYLAMYHDQGLPVLKFASFGEAVNITLGLSIIRTSVDHGTALDLAGTGTADGGSFRAALALARELSEQQDQAGKRI